MQYIQFPTQKVHFPVPDVYYSWQQQQTALLSLVILAAYTNSTDLTQKGLLVTKQHFLRGNKSLEHRKQMCFSRKYT